MSIHENESCVFFLEQGDPFVESCIIGIIRCGFQMRGCKEIHSDNESKQSLRYIDRMSIVSSIFVLKPIIDLNLKFTYLLSDHWDVFVSANNILNKSYQRYLYYPTQGVNFLGGMSYSF